MSCSSRVPQNDFERILLATIGGFDRVDRIVTNNLILPHPARRLPINMTSLILLAGRIDHNRCRRTSPEATETTWPAGNTRPGDFSKI